MHVVTEALRAGTRPFLRLFVARQDRQYSELSKLAKTKGIPVFVRPRQYLDRLVSRANHQGVLAVVSSKDFFDEEDLIRFAQQQQEPPFLLLLDGIEDPQNLGAILRTADAAGVHGVFIPSRRSVGLTPGVARASAGALEHMRVARSMNISTLIERLDAQGIPSYALDPDAKESYTQLNLTGPLALVLGAENKGVRPGVLKKCQGYASIPMKGQVASLNVSASAAVILYEVVRQRRKNENGEGAI